MTETLNPEETKTMFQPLTDIAIPGIPDQLLLTVKVTTDKLTDDELATFILCGSTTGKIEVHHNGYESSKYLAEPDGTIRDVILECAIYWMSKRRQKQQADERTLAPPTDN